VIPSRLASAVAGILPKAVRHTTRSAALTIPSPLKSAGDPGNSMAPRSGGVVRAIPNKSFADD
jgi:hypothetical protein